jgi:thioesterase domain-containing protein/acyl carrier protein
VRSYLEERLPEYLVPADYLPLETLPLLPTGKVDRQALLAPDLLEQAQAGPRVAPRDAMEDLLVDLWAEVLSLSPSRIGIHDSFFTLGGHSLLAVQLIARFRKMTGVALPVRVIFEAPTVASFARFLQRFHFQRTASAPATEEASPLVGLQTAGSKRPLFGVHALGGYVFGYINLARFLGSDRPFYGLVARGLTGEPHTRVEDMAAYYIDAIRTVQPTGPYLLMGYSHGFLIALEMAQQLKRRGEEVDLLINLDRDVSREGVAIVDPTDEQVLEAVARHVGLSLEGLEALSHEERIPILIARAQQQGLVPPDVGLEEIQPILHVCRANIRADLSYTIEPYPGKMALFRTTQHQDQDGHDWNWERFVAEVETFEVPGDHNTLIRDPNVRVLASLLKQCLDRAEGDEGRKA